MQTSKTSNIVALLSPWQSTLALFQLTAEDGATAELTLRTDTDMRTADALVCVMELLYLAAMADGKVIRDLAVCKWIKVETEKTTSSRETNVVSIPGANLHKVKFVVRHCGVDLDPLEAVLFKIWNVHMREDTPRTTEVSQYAAVRHSLVQRIVQQCGNRPTRLNKAVPIRWCLSLREEPAYPMSEQQRFGCYVVRATPLRVYDFFKRLAKIASSKKDYEDSTPQSATTEGPLLASEPFELQLDAPVPVTSSIAQAAQDCMRVSEGHVLEPRLVVCSADDIHKFLCALSGSASGSAGLVVQTGLPLLSDQFIQPLDRIGQDRSDLIRVVLRGIGGCDSLQSVDLSLLLARFASQPHNREFFWRALLDDLLASAAMAPIGELRFQSIGDEDTRWIRPLCEPAGTQPRRAVGCLRLDAMSGSDDGLLGIAALVRDMHTLDATMSSLQQIRSNAISALLKHCPKFRALRLGNARIESMLMFASSRSSDCTCNTPAHDGCGAVGLESLELDQPVIQNAQSMVVFLRLLAKPSTAIAQSLHTLVITRVHPTNPFLLVKAAALALEQVLQTNRTLHTVHVWLDRDVPLTLADKLTSHTGEEIAVQQGTTPTMDHEARKAALWSVVCCSGSGSGSRVMNRLDATVLRQIFAFMGPTRTRVVVAEYYFVSVPTPPTRTGNRFQSPNAVSRGSW